MTKEESCQIEEIDLQPIPRPIASDYSPDRDREHIRGWLAIGMLLLLAAVLLLLLISVVCGLRTWSQVEGVSAAVVGPLVGLTGTLLGFYYGQKEK